MIMGLLHPHSNHHAFFWKLTQSSLVLHKIKNTKSHIVSSYQKCNLTIYLLLVIIKRYHQINVVLRITDLILFLFVFLFLIIEFDENIGDSSHWKKS